MDSDDILCTRKSSSIEHKKLFQIFKKEIVTVDNETLRPILIDELSSDSYQSFIDFFNKHYKNRLDKSMKNEKKSVKTRNKGNKLLASINHNAQIHEDIWRLYSKSIALAPADSEELALGYGNRSYLLLHLRKYQDCMKDIDRAVAITKSDALKLKLLCRKMTCSAALDVEDYKKKKVWADIQTCFNNIQIKDKKFVQMVNQAKNDLRKGQKDIPYERKPKPVPCTSNAVAIKYNEEFGRHLVATRDIEPGEMILVQEPYVTAANSNKFYAYCSHCLCLTWASIPCDYCRLCMYCSEECKAESWKKYHDIECKILPHMQFNIALYYYYQISIRTIIMGIKEVGSIEKLKEEVKKVDDCSDQLTKGFTEDGKFDSEHFRCFYSLNHKVKLQFLTQFIKNSCLLLTFIIQTSNLFGRDLKRLKGKELAKDEEVLFINVLLLRFIISASSNAFHVNQGSHCCKKFDSYTCVTKRCCPRGATVAPLGSIINNDCSPNLYKCFTDDRGKFIYYCIQPIAKNSQVFISYCNVFYKMKLEDRRRHMTEGGYFTCKCKACTEEWPLLDQLAVLEKIAKNQNPLDRQVLIEDKYSAWIIPKYWEVSNAMVSDKNFQPDIRFTRELGKDVAKVIRACGLRSHLTCSLIDNLTMLFGRLYGIDQVLKVPETCRKV